MGPGAGDDYTRKTQAWLDRSFSASMGGAVYFAHQPIYGFGSVHASPSQASRIARTIRILNLLAGEPFAELLDVGAGEAYTADLARELFGVRAAATDLSREACLRGRQLFGVPTLACNGAALPFADRSFDVVLCSEVIEHLPDPFAVISEMMRVTRRALLISSAECAHSELERRLLVKLRDFEKPHLEINWWRPDDFTRTMGAVERQRQLRMTGQPSDRETDREAVRRWIVGSIRPEGLEREGIGIFVFWRRPDAPPAAAEPRRLPAPEPLAEWLMQPRPLGRPVDPAEEAWMRERVRCPVCLGALVIDAERASCPACAREWPIFRGGVLDLTATSDRPVRPLAELNPAEVERLRRLFAPANVWTGARALLAKGLLALVTCARDIRMGCGWSGSLRQLRRSLHEVLREADPRAEGCLLRARGNDAIYRIERGRKRHIVSQQVFFDRGYSYDQVKLVDPERLDRFPDGDPIAKS